MIARSWIALAMTVLLAAAGCSGSSGKQQGQQSQQQPSANGGPGSNGPQLPAAAPSPRTWIFTRLALTQVLSDPAVRTTISAGRVLEILRGKQQPSTAIPVIPIMSFSSYSGLETALSAGLPPYIKGVMYDAEVWALTPVQEQQNPETYYPKAAALAHAHGLMFIAAPAMNLVTAHGPTSDRPRAYLQQNIAALAARDADIIDIQAQSLERNSAQYTTFVQQAVRQARGARTPVTVLAGLSSNPPGPDVTVDMLIAAVSGTRRTVDGYWVNIPGNGSQCPTCSQPRPQLAIDLLRAPALAG